MIDHQIQSADNRTISFADYGPASGLAVLCCHGGPGSRLEPRRISEQAAAAGFRLIGIDRPGYGKSTPLRAEASVIGRKTQSLWRII